MNRMLVVGALIAAAACGDNSAACGPGTTNVDGTCTTSTTCGSGTRDDGTGTCVPDGTIVCTDGTTFDVTLGQCVIDPTVCQGGTVLIDGLCQDPTAGLTIDLEEGPEPNGLGVDGIERNAVVPAGTIQLKDIGAGGFVIHGKITPFQDLDDDGVDDADLDTYTLTVTAPTLIHVTVDGTNGLAAGFLASASVDTGDVLASWQRVGINLAGDTSARQVFLPRAGTYLIGIADSRTLFLGGVAAGGSDSDYYVTIEQLAIPTPTALTVDANGAASSIGEYGNDDLKLFTVPMGIGLNDVQLAIDQSSALAAAVVLDNGVLRDLTNGAGTSSPGGTLINLPAELVVGGIAPADTTTIVVDDLYDYALGPVDYELTIATHGSLPLPTAGGSATQLDAGTIAPGTIANPGSSALTTWYVDATSAGEILAVDLTWSKDVDGALFDQRGALVSPFSVDASDSFAGHAWRAYDGLVRFPAAGRYYFAIYDLDPAAVAGVTSVGVTSMLTPVTPTAITLNTPTLADPVGASGINVYSYDAGTTVPWQQFAISPNGSSPSATARFYDPATAFGRLDPVAITRGGVTAPSAPDPQPVVVHTYPSSASNGRVIPGGPQQFLVAVEANATSLDLAFATRTGDFAHSLGAPTPPITDTEPGTIDAAAQLYFLASPPGAALSATLVPPGAPFHPELDQLDANEAIAATSFNATASPITETLVQGRAGWSLFQIDPDPFGANGAYTLTITDTAPPTTYTISAGTTAYSDACTTGSDAQLSDPDEGISLLPIAAPAGFTFYGAPVSAITMSANGLLTFDAFTTSTFANAALPDALAAYSIIAPYWTDLDGVRGCVQTVGGKLVLQWTGHLIGRASRVVAVQAILDPADNSVELVWAPTEIALGTTATIGLQASAGAGLATQLAFDTPAAITAGTSKKLTPSP